MKYTAILSGVAALALITSAAHAGGNHSNHDGMHGDHKEYKHSNAKYDGYFRPGYDQKWQCNKYWTQEMRDHRWNKKNERLGHDRRDHN